MEQVISLLKNPAILFGLGLFIALGLVGRGDMEEFQTQQKNYCKMVAEGHWPDYEKDYAIACPPLGFPKTPVSFHHQK